MSDQQSSIQKNEELTGVIFGYLLDGTFYCDKKPPVGGSATDGKLYVDGFGKPVKCGICKKWIRNLKKHNIVDPDDDSQPTLPRQLYCETEIDSVTIEECNSCSLPIFPGSVHSEDKTVRCDPSCYADGTNHLLNENGDRITCPECLQLIGNPIEHTLTFPDDDSQGPPFWLCSGRVPYEYR